MKVFAIIVAFLTAGVIASPTPANDAAAIEAELLEFCRTNTARCRHLLSHGRQTFL
jgi:hypothetical protein